MGEAVDQEFGGFYWWQFADFDNALWSIGIGGGLYLFDIGQRYDAVGRLIVCSFAIGAKGVEWLIAPPVSSSNWRSRVACQLSPGSTVLLGRRVAEVVGVALRGGHKRPRAWSVASRGTRPYGVNSTRIPRGSGPLQ